MKAFLTLDELKGAVGIHLGESEWRTITQAEVDLFAEATGDDHWSHIDPERAKSGPFGGTIAPGYLTLSIIPRLVREIFTVEGVGMSLDYGTNKVRFPAPLRVGSRIRASADLVSVDPGAADGGLQGVLRVAVEREGGGKPFCIADTVITLFPSAESS